MSPNESRTVADIMNKKLLYVREGDRLTSVRQQIIEFGVTAVPVLDDAHRPVGMLSLRDLARSEAERLPAVRDVVCAKASDPIRRAAAVLAASPYHHLVVVDDAGVAVGIVSSVDFLRALLELPPQHPGAFEAY